MGEYLVKDIGLADKGELLIEWASAHMPVLAKIRERFAEEKPLKGIRVGACMHITKETAVLMLTLAAGGAEIYLSASNPLSTQDEVAAALAKRGIHVFGWRGETEKEYFKMIDVVIRAEPDIVIDDGGDLIVRMHREFSGIAERVIGGSEETTTGVIRERALEREGLLKFPVIAVNDAKSKRIMDNRYGTGQSALDGIMRATNIHLAGKVVVVAGYGYVGSGIAKRARGLGARVIVTEVDPIRALEAALDGFEVMPMKEAAKVGDIFITATGNVSVIRAEHLKVMKDGAVLANAGHFNVEINLKDLESMAEEVKEIRSCVRAYRMKDGRTLYLLGEGRLVNLVCAEGHPSEVMDVSFSLQALTVRYLAEKGKELKPAVYLVPEEIDKEVARLKLETMGYGVDGLTPEQVRYLESA